MTTTMSKKRTQPQHQAAAPQRDEAAAGSPQTVLPQTARKGLKGPAPAAQAKAAAAPPALAGGFGGSFGSAPAAQPAAQPETAAPAPAAAALTAEPVRASQPARRTGEQMLAWTEPAGQQQEGISAQPMRRRSAEPQVSSAVLDGVDYDSLDGDPSLGRLVRGSEAGPRGRAPMALSTIELAAVPTGSATGTVALMPEPFRDPTFTDVLNGSTVDIAQAQAHAPVSASTAATAISTAGHGLLGLEQSADDAARDKRRRLAGKPPKAPTGAALLEDRPRDAVGVVALVLGIVGFGALSPVVVVLAHWALSRVRYGGLRGRGAATAALVLGYAGLAVVIALAALWLAVANSPEPIVLLPGERSGLPGVELSARPL